MLFVNFSNESVYSLSAQYVSFKINSAYCQHIVTDQGLIKAITNLCQQVVNQRTGFNYQVGYKGHVIMMRTGAWMNRKRERRGARDATPRRRLRRGRGGQSETAKISRDRWANQNAPRSPGKSRHWIWKAGNGSLVEIYMVGRSGIDDNMTRSMKR